MTKTKSKEVIEMENRLKKALPAFALLVKFSSSKSKKYKEGFAEGLMLYHLMGVGLRAMYGGKK